MAAAAAPGFLTGPGGNCQEAAQGRGPVSASFAQAIAAAGGACPEAAPDLCAIGASIPEVPAAAGTRNGVQLPVGCREQLPGSCWGSAQNRRIIYGGTPGRRGTRRS